MTAGLVLSGGGVRGAYEAGVLCGLVEVLGLGERDRAPFRVFAGTSVGAINATFLAASSHRGDMAAHALADVWTGLEIEDYLRIDPLGLWGWPRVRRPGRASPASGRRGLRYGRSLFDPRPLELLVTRSINWERLRHNATNDRFDALVVAALDIADGATTMFAQLGPKAQFRPSRDPRRKRSLGPIVADHVLASAALPLLFPARRIGTSYYCDGGLRFNTPISPAIRCGADRLVVVSLRRGERDTAAGAGATGAVGSNAPDTAARHTAEYPSPFFLLGKLLNALLLDPVEYDLQVLERFNRLIGVLQDTLTADEMQRVQRVLVEARGAPYRALDTLVFAPSADIGVLAGEHVRAHLPHWRVGRVRKWLLAKAAHWHETREADLASYFLFDGAFARTLIDLGRQDVLARAAEVHAFFGTRPTTQPSGKG